MFEVASDQFCEWGHQKLGGVSRTFPQERSFQVHLFHMLRKGGHRVEFERGWNTGGFVQRWDLGIISGDWVRRLHVAIECKVKSTADSLSKAIGQCILYRTSKCCRHPMVCFPSDLELPFLFLEACEDNQIAIATELNILQVLKELIPMS